MANFERQPAQKTWISNLYSGTFVKSDEEFKPSYLIVNGKNISRVNLVATVIDKYEKEDGNYVSLIIDDGSAQIRVKGWGDDCKLLKDIKKGDIILLIGKIREDNISKDGIYVGAEIVKKINPNFEVLRRLELIKDYGKPSGYIKKQFFAKEDYLIEDVEEIKISSSSLRNNILNSIEKGNDIDFGSLLKDLNCPESDLSYELNELIKDGEIFEVKGKYKLLR